MKNLKVFVDFHYLKNLNKGFGQYSYHLAKALQEANSGLNYVFYIPNKRNIKKLFNAEHITKKVYYSFHRQLGVSAKNCIFHSTNQLSKILPRNKKQPFILTIHDINFIYEETVDLKIKASIQKNIDRANAIVFVSHFTMNEVNTHFNIEEETIQKVIYNGNPYKAIHLAKNEQNSLKYLFSIAEMRPYKNLDKLIEMMVYLPEDYSLILAGKGSDKYIAYLRTIINENNLNDRVILKGIVSEEEKIELLNNCNAFVFPSSREGFGLPVVEALNFNKPIFLYNKTSLPEIGGDASFYWDNLNSKYMAEVLMEKLNYFYENKDEMQKKINIQLAKFDWNKAAKQYEEIYKKFL